MIRTKPFVSEKVWGYEKWLLSTLSHGMTKIDEKTEFLGGKALSVLVGENYPLLIKLIQANERLSVQVHPDDRELAGEKIAGKTEAWYVLDADEDASIICGLTRELSKEALSSIFHADFSKPDAKENLESLLRIVPLSKGDFVFIPAGTVHAIQGGLRLLEVQQASDVTYRLYDWGREREMHIDEGISVFKPIQPKPESPFSGSFSCPYFKLEKKIISSTSEIKVSYEIDAKTGESFVEEKEFASIFVLEGEGKLFSNSGESLDVKKEDFFVFSLNEKIEATGSLELLIIS